LVAQKNLSRPPVDGGPVRRKGGITWHPEKGTDLD